MTIKAKAALTLWLTTGALGLTAQESQSTVVAPTAPGPSKTVAMSEGTCAAVAEGDIVTFAWNPAFDNAGGVAGLHDLTLMFLRADQDRIALRQDHGLKLQARPLRALGIPGADTPVTPLPNGYYQLRFRVHASHIAPGDYHLAAAFAEPEVRADYTGSAPQMTNSPARSSFCLSVSPSPRTRGGQQGS